MIDPRVQSLCDEFGLEIIGRHRYPVPGQTRAPETIRRIIERRGLDHARLVLMVFAECDGNNALADEIGLWAVSDTIIALADVIEERPSDFLAAMDKMPIGPMMALASELSGTVPQRAALVGMMWPYLRSLRENPSDRAPVKRLAKAGRSEAEKGRLAA